MTNEKALAVMPQQPMRSQLIEPTNLAELDKLGTLMATSGFFSDARDAAKAAVKILAGREMGFPPIASMVGISIIEGKPSVGSNLIAAAMKIAGYTWTFTQRDLEGCKMDVFFRGQKIGTSEFTQEDAKRADLLGKKNWSRYPRSMYFSRAISEAARTFAPEIFAGLPAYTAEELGSENTTEDGGALVPEGSNAAQDEILKDKGIEPTEKPKRGGKTRGGIISFDGLKRWGEMKKDVIAFTGDDALYYSTLKAYGYEHADEIKTQEHVTAIWKLLGAAINKIKADQDLEGQLSHAAEVLDARTFADILKRHSCEGIADVMALGGDPLAVLLKEIHFFVDEKKGGGSAA